RATTANRDFADQGDGIVNDRVMTIGVSILAASIAMALGSDHAGGWNDGSRLATVECLVDHGTWAIDDSVFVKSAADREHLSADPYGPNGHEQVPHGTMDKLYIGGHYYSDKSPVPALLMAGPY